jgi:hypothetical protein
MSHRHALPPSHGLTMECRAVKPSHGLPMECRAVKPSHAALMERKPSEGLPMERKPFLIKGINKKKMRPLYVGLTQSSDLPDDRIFNDHA